MKMADLGLKNFLETNGKWKCILKKVQKLILEFL
jgi:hypothetical protein